MNPFFQYLVKSRGSHVAAKLMHAAQNSQDFQSDFLLSLLKKNSKTTFGAAYHFNKIKSVKDFQRCIPLMNFEDYRPHVSRMGAGETNILTAEAPLMFNLTSGTTSLPKLIPVPPSFDSSSSALMRAWLASAMKDHPKMFSGMALGITSSEVEGYTECGIPYGSTSGRIYKRIPAFLRSSYVLPYWISEILDYDLRYQLIARLALEADVTFLTSPNPSTLLRLSKVMSDNIEPLIKQIYDGTLPCVKQFNHPKIRVLKNKVRAAQLESAVLEYGILLPRYVWPNLALIGCWLGGTVGILAEKVRQDFGHVPLRDLGYLASEGRFTLPMDDESPFGLPDILNNFFEFVREADIENESPRIYLIHELEEGARYYIFITNSSGLCRYDMNDIVEAGNKRLGIPSLRFLRKGRDMGNITGEKLHANQCIEAMKSLNLEFFPFRFYANTQDSRYDLYIETGRNDLPQVDAQTIDTKLQTLNIEYQAKRKSNRLEILKIHFMKCGWGDAEKLAAIRMGQREVQYKSKIIGDVLEKNYEII